MTICEVGNELLDDRGKRFRRDTWAEGYFVRLGLGTHLITESGDIYYSMPHDLVANDWEEVCG